VGLHDAGASEFFLKTNTERGKEKDMATVSLRHIVKIYPNTADTKKEKKTNLLVTDEGVLAVQDFNLEIADQEFIVLVGPSGCGKSTTLRMVAGLEEISKGELYIDDKLMNDVAPKDRDIAMVFQNYALYPHMTVRQNMEFPLKLRKVPKDQIDRAVNQAAEILGITQYLERKPKALSGGQRQRVAIGRAIVREPKVLLMDEPLSNLDAKLRNQMRAEIIKLRQRIPSTFIYVTHDQTEAMTLGDRIVIMKDGVIQQIGTPQEVYDSPINMFVAGFIGVPQMNFYDGKLLRSNGRYAVVVDNAVIELSEEKQKNLADHQVAPQDIVVGVRPEHITLDGQEDKMIKGTVDVSELMGSAVHLHINAVGKDGVIIVPTLDLKGNKSFAMGSQIEFTFGGNVAHIFAKDSGKNLEFSNDTVQ
jgi:multiple sugar transport system ATP-binding protein